MTHPWPREAVAASHRCHRVPCHRCGVGVYTSSPAGIATCQDCKRAIRAERQRERYQARKADARKHGAPRMPQRDPATVYAVIEREPGITPPELARRLGMAHNAHGVLITLDNHGYLVSEDDAGRLYPFGWGEV